METLGQRIRRLRKEEGWTQADLAQFLDVCTSSVSQYESDHVHPGLLNVARLADRFGVSLDYLHGRSECRQTASTETYTIEEDVFLKNLTNDLQHVVLASEPLTAAEIKLITTAAQVAFGMVRKQRSHS